MESLTSDFIGNEIYSLCPCRSCKKNIIQPVSWYFMQKCGAVNNPISLSLYSTFHIKTATVTEVLKKFLAFYVSLRFITAFTKVRHCFLKIHFNIISIPSLLSNRSVLFRFQINILYALFLPLLLHSHSTLHAFKW